MMQFSPFVGHRTSATIKDVVCEDICIKGKSYDNLIGHKLPCKMSIIELYRTGISENHFMSFEKNGTHLAFK